MTTNSKNTGAVNSAKNVNANNASKKVTSKKGTSKPAEKEEKKEAEKKAPKEKKVTLASKLDVILTAGGAWEKLISQANAASKELGTTTKFNIGTLKGHINYRVKKNPAYLGKLKISDKGIGVAAKVVKEKANA